MCVSSNDVPLFPTIDKRVSRHRLSQRSCLSRPTTSTTTYLVRGPLISYSHSLPSKTISTFKSLRSLTPNSLWSIVSLLICHLILSPQIHHPNLVSIVISSLRRRSPEFLRNQTYKIQSRYQKFYPRWHPRRTPRVLTSFVRSIKKPRIHVHWK